MFLMTWADFENGNCNSYEQSIMFRYATEIFMTLQENRASKKNILLRNLCSKEVSVTSNYTTNCFAMFFDVAYR